MSFPLFDLVPSLATRVPRVTLGAFPTPVESLDPLCREVGVAGDAWVKRDDISSPIYGGNKVRTLELLFGAARANGSSLVLATGAYGSNHALATALHAPRAELRPAALLFPQPVSRAAWTNLRALVDSDTVLHSIPHWSALPLAMGWRRLTHTASRPYVMVPGGATPLGALGYVSAGLELGRQLAAQRAPVPRRVVVGVGSTCTSAGLLVGLHLAAHLGLGFAAANLPRLISVRVSPWPVTSRLRILSLAARTAQLLHELSGGAVPRFEAAQLGARFEVDGRYLGPGYGHPSAAGTECEALWSRAGLGALDSTYSAKAAARVVASLRAKEPGPVLFWCTKSSVPLPAFRAGTAPAERAIPPRIRDWLRRAERALPALS